MQVPMQICGDAGVFCQRAEANIGSKLESEVTFHMVRSVAPNKDMYCISFRLPRGVAFAGDWP